MPSTADTQQQAERWAAENIRKRIQAFVDRHDLAEVLQTNVLDNFNLGPLHSLDVFQLQAVETLLQPLTLYRSKP